MTEIQTIIAKALAIVLLGIGLFMWGHHVGSQSITDKWQASITADAVAQANLVHASDIVTTQVVTQTIERIKVVLTQGATITKEVPLYVTQKADAQCTLTTGFARVLNAASGGEALDANATTGANDSALGISLSDATSVIASNLIQCRADQARLRGLQTWITGQQKLTEQGPH